MVRQRALARSAIATALLALGSTVWGANQNALNVIEAESADASQGVTVTSRDVEYFDNGDWVKYAQTNFGTGVNKFNLWVAVDPASAGQTVEIRLDSPTGTRVGQLVVQSTGGWSTFTKQSVQLNQMVSGTHDLYLVGVGSYGVGNLDKFQFETGRSAFNVIEAESANASQGVTIDSKGVGSFDGGDWVKYNQVNFGSGAASFTATVAVDQQYAGQKIDIRLDSPTGPLVGQLTVQNTNGWTNYVAQKTNLTQTVTGTHDLYLVANGNWGVANIDKFQFSASGSTSRTPHAPIVLSGASNLTIANYTITGGTGPCITLTNSNNIVIDNVDLSQCGADGVKIAGGGSITVKNSNIHDLSHAVGHADGVYVSGASNVTVQNNQFSNIWTDDPNNPRGCGTSSCATARDQNENQYAVAVRFENTSNGKALYNTMQKVGTGVYAQSGAQQIVVDHNTATTIWGPYPRGQFTQFAGLTTSAGNKITCNKVDNSGTNWAEDAINIYDSNGLSDDPSQAVYIAYNKIRGGGNSGSGSAIQIGDGHNGGHVRVEGNRIVNPGGSGIGISNVSNVVVNNKLYRAANATNSYVGIYTNAFTCPSTDMTNIFAYNRFNWATDVGSGRYPIRNRFDWDGSGADRGCVAHDTSSASTSAVFRSNSVIPYSTAPGTNVVNDSGITAAIFDEVIPQCN